MKINNNNIIESAKKNLEKLFSSSILLNKLNDNQFKELVIKQISILNYYEGKNKSKKNNKANSFLKKLNEVNNNNYSLINIEYSKIEDAMDDVNYLKTFINNVYKIDIDSMDNSKDDNVVKAEPIVNDSSRQTSPMNSNFFGGMNMPMDGIFNQEMFQDQWYRKMAYDKYCSEVISGEFYEYKTKPLSVIIFKYLIAALILLFIVSIVVKIVFQILVSTIGVLGAESKITSVSIFSFFSTFPDIIMILLMGFIFYRLIKPTKNDNIKYFFHWKSLILIFSIILISLTINIPDVLKWYSNREKWEISENNEKIKNMYSYLAMSFVYYGEFVFIVILIIVASVFNPKKDVDRINKKLESLYNEIKSGQKDVAKSW